ncbi:unnamed protein product [Brassica rapa subsp. narinosa]
MARRLAEAEKEKHQMREESGRVSRELKLHAWTTQL